MRLAVYNVSGQKAALRELAKLTEKAMLDPNVRAVAIALTRDCTARDDRCELEAIFGAVKHGDERVAALSRGVRYVSDPRGADFFTSPSRLLAMCEAGSCAEDCDGQTALVAALAGSLGFVVGLRAWGHENEKEYVHVYAVARVPKRTPKDTLGLDTTVEQSYVGWEPPGGRALTAWIH